MKKIFAAWSGLKLPLQILIMTVFSVCLALLIELFFNLKLLTLSDAQKGIHEISLDTVSSANVKPDGNGGLYCNDPVGVIAFDVGGYVGQLVVEYGKECSFSQNIEIKYTNAYGAAEKKTYYDTSPLWLKSSSHNIGKNVQSVVLNINNEQKNIVINGIYIRNQARFNFQRFAFFAILFTAASLLFCLRKIISTKVEIGFVIAALAAGLEMIICLPLMRVGYDEEAHLKCAYQLSFGAHTQGNDALYSMLCISLPNDPLYRTDTYEEYLEFRDYLNENVRYYGTENDEKYTVLPRQTSRFTTFGYLHEALVINIARLLKLDFGYIYILARLTNLFMYTAVMFFAIKILKKGKILMALIGLTPTALFLASCISYDTVVTSFICLGFAWMYNGIVSKDAKISWQQCILPVCAMGFGCLPKAVYAPVLLFGLLIPAANYKDSKSKYIARAGMIAAFCLLMMTFVLPELGGGEVLGDNRGGDTSHTRQMSNIFAHPAAYAGLLLKSIAGSFFDYTLGSPALEAMHLFDGISMIAALDILIVFAVLTHDVSGSCGERMNFKSKIAVWVISFAATALIWTAMYLSFTEVGVMSEIRGVQGRYFIPLLFPLLMTLSPAPIKIRVNFDRVKYNTSVLLCGLLIVFTEIFFRILSVCGM